MSPTATNRRNGLRAATAAPATVRVAVYTRKSTEEGLDQEFNSLDAQRQAVEAFVASQRGEGWVALPERYDDGGYTGANIDRPAFKRLLRDIEAGKVDVVAVYKIDRLSRSLLDFAQVIRVFEQHGVTFVSITQQFSTTSSMGKLTLNILMSFAEFERETISERTRDKMAATRRKGMWTGGRLVLGYDLKDRKLVVNAVQAERVRDIFQLYLDLGSIMATIEELRRRGWNSKTGSAFDKPGLRRLLMNPLYIGKVGYQGQVYDGAQEAILDQKTWDAVQHQLRNHGKGYRTPQNKNGALLRGLLRCGTCGSTMVPHYSQKNGRRYGYYVCLKQQKEGAATCPGSRVPATDMEQFIVDRIRDIGKDPSLLAETIAVTKRDMEARKPELVGELRRLDGEKRRLGAERENLLKAVAHGGAGVPALVQRLGQVDEELGKATDKAENLTGRLAALESKVIDEDDLRQVLATFDPVWDQLFPREQARILGLLVDVMTYRAGASEVDISFRPGGVRTLAQQNGRKP